MNTQGTKAVATLDKDEKPAVAAEEKNTPAPLFVEAEKMFEKFAELTKEIAQRAFTSFKTRGGEFGRELEDWFRAESEVLRPVAVEMSETENTLTIKAAVPGFTTDQIEISIKDNLLVISGEAEKQEEKTEDNVVYSDWKSDRFFRQLILPADVDAAEVKAELKDGILTINMPKAEPTEERHIAVTAK